MSKRYVVADLHGNYKGLVQAIDRSPFKATEDQLISLGDLVDGGTESAMVVDFLAELPNVVLIKGNHDEWFKHWLHHGVHPCKWLQGGHTTAKSYIEYLKIETGEDRSIVPDGYGSYKCNLTYIDIPVKHRQFLNSGVDYHVDEDGNLYVHGGFNRHFKIDEQQVEDIYYWDRDLWMQALSFQSMTDKSKNQQAIDGYGQNDILKFKMKDKFNKIFIGHTTTLNWNTDQPMTAANIINLDTGAGFKGRVTIMDVETGEYWQSDLVEELYGKPFHR